MHQNHSSPGPTKLSMIIALILYSLFTLTVVVEVTSVILGALRLPK